MQRTHRRLARRFAAVVAVAFGSTASLAAPANAATYTSGHFDILDVDRVGSALTLNIKTHGTNANDNVSPASSTWVVPASTKTTIPTGSTWNCLGATGTSTYVLPQTQQAGVLWVGWDTAGIPASGPASIDLKLNIAGSTMPSGAKFAIFTTSLSTATYKLNTNTASGCKKTAFPVNRNVHAHANWAFSKPGTYKLKFRATGSGVTASPWQTYTFVVG